MAQSYFTSWKHITATGARLGKGQRAAYNFLTLKLIETENKRCCLALVSDMKCSRTQHDGGINESDSGKSRVREARWQLG